MQHGKNDRSFSKKISDPVAIKTRASAASPAFLHMLLAIRESNPWALFLCLTRRWHHVSQEMVHRDPPPEAVAAKWCNPQDGTAIPSCLWQLSTIIVLFSSDLFCRHEWLRKMQRGSRKTDTDKKCFILHFHTDSLWIFALHCKHVDTMLTTVSWFYRKLPWCIPENLCGSCLLLVVSAVQAPLVFK